MKNFSVFLIILAFCPVFAACPIDELTNSCVAEFNPVPTLNPIPMSRNPNAINKPFQSIVNTTPTTKEIGPNNTRTFGPTSLDYNYNSSCQFGICRNTGTPTSLTGGGK